MILLDILDVMDDLKGDQREFVLSSLLGALTSLSHETILEFQLEYDGSNSFVEFLQYQNELIRECVRIEMRRKEGLRPLSLRTEIYL